MPVPTLGDMLRMDKNGRFTMSGDGASLASTLKPSASSSQRQGMANSAPTSDNRDRTPMHTPENPSPTPSQRARMTSENDAILRPQPASTRPKQPPQNNTPAKSPNLYVVRNPRGLYLGMYTLASAQRCWTKCRLQDSVIIIGQPLEFKRAARFADQALPATIVKSDRELRITSNRKAVQQVNHKEQTIEVLEKPHQCDLSRSSRE